MWCTVAARHLSNHQLCEDNPPVTSQRARNVESIIWLYLFLDAATSVGGGYLAGTTESIAVFGGIVWTVYPFTILFAFSLGKDKSIYNTIQFIQIWVLSAINKSYCPTCAMRPRFNAVYFVKYTHYRYPIAHPRGPGMHSHSRFGVANVIRVRNHNRS